MEQEFDLGSYLTGGVESIVKGAMRASLKNPKESLFMGKFAIASKKAANLREQASKHGNHVPPFLIASITGECNLHCAGCYSRANGACHDEEVIHPMTSDEWGSVFAEAQEMGIGFVLLAGGEPFLRRDVLDEAAKYPSILFPVFTNGTLFTDGYMKLLDKHRNVLPILSIEGEETTTNDRRGNGVYKRVTESMEALQKAGIFFGASVTVTKENMEEVMSESFLGDLYRRGCKTVIYVEFVPVTEETKDLAPGDEERDYIMTNLNRLRQDYDKMVLIAFPGDEKTSGGCLAAGRGFFHINAHGGAEPCPFSPYSDISVRKTSLKEAMQSRLFVALRDGEVLMEDHAGGCVLFECKDQVEALLQR